MGVSFEEVLDELGWKDGFRIPVANEENKRLEIEIEKKSKRKARLVSELERSEERIKSIEKHAANIEIEHDYNQKIITAQAAQIEAEDHLARLGAGGKSAVAQEIRNLEKEKKDLKDKNILLEKELAKIAMKNEEFKKTLNFDRVKLVELEESLNSEEEKSHKIESFIKNDAKHFKKLQLERERLTMDLETHKNAVIRAVDEVNELETMLDRTAKLYVETLKEQCQLINRWKQSVSVLKQRDNGIQETLREIDTLREIGCDKMEVYRESEQFLENQTNSNKQLEDSIKKLERKLAIAKDERQRISREIEDYQHEYKTQTKTLEDLARRTRQVRTDAKRKKMLIGKKRKKVDETSKQIEEVRATLKEIGNQSHNVGDGLKQLEDMIEKEEKRKILIAKETSRLQALIIRTASQISDLESEKKILELQKQGELKKSELLGAYKIREDKRLAEKKKVIYHLDIDIEKCEIRLERATGTGGIDEAEVEKKQKIITDLEKLLNQKKQVNKLLQGQITSLEHDMRKVSNSISSDNDELQRLRNRKQDLCLSIEGAEKQYKSMLSQNEEKQVEESILSLRVTQAEELLNNIGDKVYNLDKYRLQIEAAMKERKAEIRVHEEALILQKRLAINDCSDLRSSIFEKKSRVQNLKTRYDICIAAMGNSGNDGNDGNTITTTILITQRAQEKYMLQEEGDKLDATIRRTEQEILSMENTLRVVNACNDKYKMSLGPVEDDGTEQAERRKIDDEMYRAIETMRRRREQLDQTRDDVEKMRKNYEISLDDVKRAKEEKDNKLWNVTNLEKQINEQKERILRADKSLRKLFKDIQRMCECSNDEMILLQEKDIATRELQEQNLVSLQRITELTIRHVEVEAYVKKLLASRNINLPCAQHLKPTPSPSRCDTITSELTERAKSRTSVLSTSRESLGRVHNIEAQFSPDGARSTRKNVSPAQQSSRSTARSQQSQRINAKHLSSRK